MLAVSPFRSGLGTDDRGPDMTDRTESQVATKARPGSAEGGAETAEELFRAVYPTLAGWAGRLVGQDAAQDVASEAFARLMSRGGPVESPRSYLYVTAANLIRDYWRKAERERRAVGRMSTGTLADPVSWPAQDVDVRALIAALPPRLRETFLLRHYGGYSTRETAGLLSRPEGTVKADLFRARATLKRAVREPRD
jgi:RNA polymerase sigma-70 factor (ECF subfamily)